MIIASYNKFILKQRIIRVGGYSILVVLTGSMEPTIRSGEMILIKQQKDYRQGDIVTYVDENNYFITHRITQLENDKCITKGDNNNIEDSKFFTSQIQGKVVYHSKVFGYFILYILKPLILVYLGTLLFFIFNENFFKSKNFSQESKEINIEKTKLNS